ncbi:Katanin p80 WD40 repeat-containing subunit B1 [Boothiomyces sp. JEL0838]|nr:Katanin p80 WD40 repeat-containing subunit B1 [Boothiomyces sp. JEL0838]
MVKSQKIVTFNAHSMKTTCAKIGPKSGRVMATGGQDRNVNLWAIGKQKSILSLSGHVTQVESVALDWPEELVVAGSAGGSLKLWDLEQAKVIRTLAGHRSNVKSVEFHPFGEFFASGSSDLSIKIWDVRRKGCIQTYHGHDLGINSLKITPDGRWIASGSEDGTVKNFEMISSFKESYSEQIVFTPNGQHLLAGAQDALQILTWEPIALVNEVPAKWSNVKDIKVLPDTDKAIACTINGTYVDVWGFKISETTGSNIDEEYFDKVTPETVSQKIEDLAYQTKQLDLDNTAKPETAVPLKTSKKFKYIPSPDGSRPLNLDLQSFIKQVPGKPSQPMLISSSIPINTIEDALDTMNFRHTSVLNILTSRLQHIRSIRNVWNEEDIRASIVQLLEIRETSVAADILRILNCKPKLLSLEICSMIIPLLCEMLFEMYEEYIKLSCNTLQLLSKSFTDIIISTINIAKGRQTLDFNLEDRLMKSQKCKQEFENAYIILTELSAGGELGNIIKDTLNELQILYYDNFKKLEILSQEEIEILFSNIIEIINVSQIFLNALEKQKIRSDGIVLKLGSILLSQNSNFLRYEPYCSNHSTAMELIKFKLNDPSFMEFTKVCAIKCRGMDLASYLLKPIQRICKYPLLIREVIKFTPESHVDFEELIKANDQMQENLLYINRLRGINDERIKLVHEAIENIVFGEHFYLPPSNSRKLISKGYLLKPKTSTIYSTHSIRYVVLLSDYLILCKPIKKSDKLNMVDLVSLLSVTISECRGKEEVEKQIWIDNIKNATEQLILSICEGKQAPPELRKHNITESESFDADSILETPSIFDKPVSISKSNDICESVASMNANIGVERKLEASSKRRGSTPILDNSTKIFGSNQLKYDRKENDLKESNIDTLQSPGLEQNAWKSTKIVQDIPQKNCGKQFVQKESVESLSQTRSESLDRTYLCSFLNNNAI